MLYAVRSWSMGMLIGLLLACIGTAEAWEFASPHRDELERHRDAPTLAELIGDGRRSAVPLQKRAMERELAATVFGYLPYWIDRDDFARLDYDLLSHISVFSVEVNANGTLGNDHDWPWTALIDSAHAHGVKVILTATLFGNEGVLRLLGSEEHRETFKREIRDKLLEGNADGVNIDFEGSGSNGWPRLINGFLADLTDYLHREIPGCEVSFAGPAVDWSRRYDFPGLAASCDYIFIMGYAFAGSWSQESGPNAPLLGGGRNITTTVTGDYGAVARKSPEKLILGVPYYGNHWQTVSSARGAGTTRFMRSLFFSATQAGAEQHGEIWDGESQTPWYRYQRRDVWNQVWYDNATSLGFKYDLALKHGYGGVGMWALGYDGDRRELWDLLEEKIGRREAADDLVSAVELLEPAGPVAFQLFQNYPNPFAGETRIDYEIPGAGRVDIGLFDVLGRRIGGGNVEHDGAGRFQWRWDGLSEDGERMSTGLYSFRVRFEDVEGGVMERVGRMVLMR
jgi:spore germination protein YaaH